jgi:cysteine desulfurase/selenocysteine lyase
MIERVGYMTSTFRAAPERFEAGTPHITGAIGLAAALRYVTALRPDAHAYEQQLLALATERLSTIPGLKIVGTAREKVAVVSFLIEGAHPHDIGTLLDADAIAIRVGHHCCMPLMEVLGITGTARASFAFYNTEEEILRLETSLRRIQKMLSA